MDCLKLAELLFPDVDKDTEYYEAQYPPRNLKEGAAVTRFAPSPTGFVHFGGLFPVLVGERLAHQSDGVFYLRIEDTDSKREVEGAENDIIKAFESFGIKFDESVVHGGEYGPYRQSDRRPIYRCYAKKLVAEGKAYPCFCSAEELAALREKQEAEKVIPGYYGKYVKCRDLSYEQVEENLKAGKPFVLRFKSFGSSENKVKFTDLIKGTIEITENDIDHVLLKSDGMPTYHLAHAVDDHLMHTTHVIRGEEWLPSLPYHIQLFKAFDFKLPKYLHISQLMKLAEVTEEDGSVKLVKKKLSKRDKGAGLTSYISDGYAPECVTEYVMTLLNSNFEDWRRANPNAPLDEFKFSIKKMSASGSLFDLKKLADVSKNVLSRMSGEEVYNRLVNWTASEDKEFNALLTADREKAVQILSIGRGGAKPRKDFGLYSEVKGYIGFFYDEYFEQIDSIPENFDNEDVKKAIALFIESYDANDEQNVWFDKIKAVAAAIGYSPDIKAYRANPEAFGGHVGDVSMFLRIAVTGKMNSPDMYEVMSILGKEKVLARLTAFADKL